MAANAGQGIVFAAILQINGTAAGAVQVVTPATVTGTQIQTLQDAAGTIALLSGSQVWSGTQDFSAATVKVSDGSQFSILNASDPTKIAEFDASGLTTATTRTYTLPDGSGTLALLGLAQTWTAVQDFTATQVLVATAFPGDNTTKAASTAFVTAAIAASGGTNPMTTLGDMVYGGAAGVETRLAGNITTTPMFLKSTGTGSAATTPAWTQAAFADLSGSVAAGQMPALTGDVTSTAGTVATTLATTQPGAHTWSAQQTFSSTVAILTTPSNDTALSIAGILPSTATGQVGIASQAQPTSSATTSYMAIYYRAASAAAAYTQASTYGSYIDTPIKGAGSTMTTLYGLYIAAQNLGTTNYAVYTNAGFIRFGDTVAIASTPNADTTLRMTGTLSSSVAAGQVGIDLEVNPTSSATGSMTQLYTRNRSAAAAYTQGNAYSIYIDTPNYGAGSTVTVGKAIFIDNQTGAGTNYAIHTKTGLVLIGDSTTSTSATTGALVVTGGIGTGGPIRSAGMILSSFTDTAGGAQAANFLVNANPAASSALQWTGALCNVATSAACAQNLTSGSGGLMGGQFQAAHFGTGTLSLGIGGSFVSQARAGGGPVTSLVAGQFQVTNAGSNTSSAATGINIGSGINSGGGAITTLYGLRVQDQTVGGTNYAIYTGLGTIRLGDVVQTASAQESTGAGSALLGTNCPAVTITAPYKWIKGLTSDGSTVYWPVWK